MNTKGTEAIVLLLAAEFQGFEGDLDALESQVCQRVRQIGQQAMQQVLGSHRWGYQGSRVDCRCGGDQRFVGYRARTVLTRLGPVRVSRGYYRCAACGGSRIPFDTASGLGASSLSHQVSSAVSLLAAESSFQQVSQLLATLLGLSVDDNTVCRTAEAAGGVVAARLDEAVASFRRTRQFPEGQGQPGVLYVSMDGTSALTREGWKEAKCGAVYWEDPVAGHRARYVARLTDSESFGWLVWHEACRWGLREAGEVVVIGDGAAWIWKQADRLLPGAVQILDFYHASEHVWACANGLYGEGSAAARSWAEKMVSVLWEAGGVGLLNRLRCSSRCRGSTPEPLGNLMGYVASHSLRMRYPQFRAQGLSVGSGPVEAACKRLVGGRLKQSGMHWTREGANAILSLRTLWFNGQWPDFWQSKPLAA